MEDAPHHNALLNHKNALEYTGGKRVDYVMTGNVVNAPDNPDKLSTILACANMLREGGVAVHMVGYGEQRTAGSVIGMKVLPAFLQQSHDKIVPEGAFEPWQLPQRTRMMVFTQQHEIHYGAPEYEFFKQFRLNKERADMVVATSDGSTQFRLGDYFDYFLTHPERLTTMPPLTTMSLGVMPLLEDLQQGKEWSTYAAYTLAQDSGFASKVKPPVPEIEKMKWPQTCEIIQSYLDWRDEAIVTVAAELARDKTPQVQVSSVTHAAPAQSASLNL